jgi:hypothetical protein
MILSRSDRAGRKLPSKPASSNLVGRKELGTTLSEQLKPKTRGRHAKTAA